MLLERAHRGLLNTIIIVGIGPSFLELWACEVWMLGLGLGLKSARNGG